MTELQNIIKTLHPSAAIWREIYWSALDEIMVCRLTVSSHYRNQCWFEIIRIRRICARYVGMLVIPGPMFRIKAIKAGTNVWGLNILLTEVPALIMTTKIVWWIFVPFFQFRALAIIISALMFAMFFGSFYTWQRFFVLGSRTRSIIEFCLIEYAHENSFNEPINFGFLCSLFELSIRHKILYKCTANHISEMKSRVWS